MPRRKGETAADRRRRDNRVVELTERGVPAEHIASVVGISTTHVFRIRARRLGSGTAPRRFTVDELATAESMLVDGASIAEIARTLGRHPATVNKRFRGRGWTRQQIGQWGALMHEVHRTGQI